MARGRLFVVIQVAFGLAYIGAGSHVAYGQTGLDRPGISLGLPGLNILGLVKTSPTSINLGSQGLNATLPGISAAGVITTTPAALGLNNQGLAANGPAISGVITAAPATVSLNDKGLNATVPATNIAGLVATTAPTSVSLSSSGLSTTVSSLDVAGVVTTTPTSASLGSNGLNVTVSSVNVAGLVTTTPTSLSLNDKGLNVTVSGVSVAGLVSVSPTSVGLDSKGLDVTLPAVNVADVVAVGSTTLSLNGSGATVALPDIKVGGQSLWTLPVRDVINHVSPVAQLFAGMGSAEAFGPVEQLLNSLAFGNDAPSACASVDASALGPLPTADISVWNAVTVGRTEHGGYQVGGGNGAPCGSTMGFQTTERAQLPGVMWDASSAFGFKKGSFHMGFSGGATESDTQVRATAALRDAGVVQAGSTRMQAWSASGFSLLTNDNWYAGTAFGGAWGRTESMNFVLGSESDYDTSTFVGAGFLGTVIPLTETVRFDVRSTLSFQRTVADAHVDSLGLVYGDHTIESADAVLSGRLFGVFRHDDMTIRPFIQAGITHHLSYSNQLEINGIVFNLREDDTSLFAATGLDFEISNTLQLSLGVRHDRSSDYESVTGRFGLSLRLN